MNKKLSTALSLFLAGALSFNALGAGKQSPKQPKAPASQASQKTDPYLPIIDKYDREDREFYRAIIKVESTDNPNATSRVGARGLMQIMPSTWKEIRKSNDFQNAYVPEQNIKTGIQYFNWIEKYLARKVPDWNKKSRIEQYSLEAAAYNGGIGKLQKTGWNISKMPKESRDYVQRMKGKYKS